MSAGNDTIWSAAKLLCKWETNGIRYQLLSVPREAIDEDSDEADAHLLVGIDSGNVRRIDVMMDTAYSRGLDRHKRETVAEAMESAPQKAREVLKRYA